MLVSATKGRFPKNRLVEFMNSMASERKFFLLTIDEVLSGEILFFVENNGRILGIGGIRFLPGILVQFFKLPVEFIVVLEEFQGHSIGRQIRTALDEDSTERYSYLVVTIFKDNEKALNLYKNSRFRYLGATKDRVFLLRPSNFVGLIIYYLLKIALWFLLPIRSFFERERLST